MRSVSHEKVVVTQGGRICTFGEIVGGEEFGPFPEGERACRVVEVRFEMAGKDQGWTSEGEEGTFDVILLLIVDCLFGGGGG